ncbi:MAG: stalk domain-containing protein [Tissierellia bacterium]|nr:stalk domain-containing protein [Tissierellia bacterium]
MRKILALGLLCVLFLAPTEARAITSEEVYRETVSPGVVRREVRVNLGSRKAMVDVIEADLNNPYVEFRVLAGKGRYTQKTTVMDMANGNDAFSAINGDFFNMSKQGAPFGPSVIDGSVTSSPLLSVGLYSFGIDGNDVAHIEAIGFQGTATASDGASYPIGGLNKTEYTINHTAQPSHQNAIQLYNDFWASPSRGRRGSAEVLVDGNGVVQKISLSGPIPGAVPQGATILQVHGRSQEFIANHVTEGSTLKLNYRITPERNWKFLIGGHAMLVQNGTPLPYTLDANSIDGRRARSAVAMSQDGKTVYLLATESGTSRSGGMRLAEWVNTVHHLGAYHALNLDGGGSTTMVAREHGEFTNDFVTRPEKGGSQRKIPNAIGILNNAPQGPLSHISLSGPSAVVEGEVATYGIATGWDDNYNPKDISQLNYSITDTVIGGESWSGNRFLSSQRGETTVVLTTMEGISATKVVQIQSAKALKSFSLLGKLQAGADNYLRVEGVTKNGRTIPLDPSQMEWEAEGIQVGMNTDYWKQRDAQGNLLEPAALVQFSYTEAPYGSLTVRHGEHSSSLRVENPAFEKVHMQIGNQTITTGTGQLEMDVAPVIQNDRTLVPVRFLMEAMGAEVSWDQDSHTATVQHRGNTIALPTGENHALVNGQKIPLDQGALLIDDRTMVPIRFISENTGVLVEYIHQGRHINLYQAKL